MKLKQNLNKSKWNIKNLYLKNEHKIIPILNFIKNMLRFLNILIIFAKV